VAAPPGAAAVRLERGADDLADVVRALDAANVRVANLQLHAPSLDDVFLAKTGRKLDLGDGDADAGAEEGARPRSNELAMEQA
jgi:ABC-2 type transport system ATP-binding protein